MVSEEPIKRTEKSQGKIGGTLPIDLKNNLDFVTGKKEPLLQEHKNKFILVFDEKSRGLLLILMSG